MKFLKIYAKSSFFLPPLTLVLRLIGMIGRGIDGKLA
jgi:hypothetical protein